VLNVHDSNKRRCISISIRSMMSARCVLNGRFLVGNFSESIPICQRADLDWHLNCTIIIMMRVIALFHLQLQKKAKDPGWSSMGLRMVLGVLVLMGSVPPCPGAAGARMVMDIKTEGPPLYSSATVLAAFDDKILFSSFDDRHLSGLWLSDGTHGGTEFITDPCPPYGSRYGLVLGHQVIFETHCPSSGHELWTTDGTKGGTRLLLDIYPGPGGHNSFWWWGGGYGIVQQRLFFAADDGMHGRELWKTDGTPQGTGMVKDIRQGDSSSKIEGEIVGLGEAAFFRADDGEFGAELWRTDGTEAGTELLKDIHPGGGSSFPANLTLHGNRLFFTADDGVHGRELWKTDGTPQGTVLAVDVEPGPSSSGIREIFSWQGMLYWGDNSGLRRSYGTPSSTQMVKWGARNANNFQPAGAYLFFLANNAFGYSELWRSDGTEAGTHLVKEINNTYNSLLVASGDLVYFNTGRNVSYYLQDLLWRSDGTEEGTFVVMSTPEEDPYAWFRDGFAVLDGILYLGTMGLGEFGGLWRTDGTVAGTWQVASPRAAASSQVLTLPGSLAPDGSLLFSADDGVHGLELWRSDGGPIGTRLLVDFAPGAGHSWHNSEASSVGSLLSGEPLVQGDDPSKQFWMTDGSAEGTIQVPDVVVNLSWTGDLGDLGGVALLEADNGIHGYELWRTDGTPEGTRMVKDINLGQHGSSPDLMGFAGETFMLYADDGIHGAELWATDGSPQGTVLVKDIHPGSKGSSYMGSPAPLSEGGILLFTVHDGVHGCEWWRTDGTEGGTRLVKDINPGAGGIDINRWTVNGAFVYWMSTFMGTWDGPWELWISDGLEEGTRLLRSTGAIPAVELHESGSFPMIPLGTEVLFAFLDEMHGVELWITDGTEEGTHLLKDICAGPRSSLPHFLVSAPEGIYFSAFDFEAGYELWRTDGTEEGTIRVADLWPGPGSSMPFEALRLSDGRLVFSAMTPEDGLEVWETDGTEEHTLKAADILPGPASSYPRFFVQGASSVYFTATDGVHGFELWTLPVESSGAVEAASLRAAKERDGGVVLRWGHSCYYRDGDYAVYSGPLGSWSEVVPLTCSTGGERRFHSADAGSDIFFLVVPRGSEVEGSYGLDGSGAERNPSAKACAPQAIHPCP